MKEPSRAAAGALALSLALAAARAHAQTATPDDAAPASDASAIQVLPESHTDSVVTGATPPPPTPVPPPPALPPHALEISADAVRSAPPHDEMIDLVPADRGAIDAVCRDALGSTDYLMWTGTAALLVGGAVASYFGFRDPVPTRTLTERFLAGLGPGMIVGAIGYPFPRGVLRDDDAMWQTCRHLHDHPHRQYNGLDTDYEYADRIIYNRGGPASALLIWLLAAATSWIATGLTAAWVGALQDPHMGEYVQLIGGIVPGLFVGWLVVPPTPATSAARRYRNGAYRTQRAFMPPNVPMLTFQPIEPGGLGMGISVTF